MKVMVFNILHKAFTFYCILFSFLFLYTRIGPICVLLNHYFIAVLLFCVYVYVCQSPVLLLWCEIIRSFDYFDNVRTIVSTSAVVSRDDSNAYCHVDVAAVDFITSCSPSVAVKT